MSLPQPASTPNAQRYLLLWLATTGIMLVCSAYSWQQWQQRQHQHLQLTQQTQRLRASLQQQQTTASLFAKAQPLIEHWQRRGLLHAARQELWLASLLSSQQAMPRPQTMHHELLPGLSWGAASANLSSGLQQHSLRLQWQGVSEVEVLSMLEDFSSRLPSPLDIQSCHFSRSPAQTVDTLSPLAGLDASCQLSIYSWHSPSAQEEVSS